MEKAHWMLMERREFMKPNFQTWRNSINDSWEEKAFAEDASGRLGGYVWPPRSYSCSFCKRDFRSAQALGGHMNVHRRDRARLKHSISNNSGDDHHHNDESFHCQNDNTQADYRSFDSHFPSSIGSSRVSAPSTKENLSDHTSSIQEMLHFPSWELETEKNSKEEDDDFVETDLFMGFNVFNPNQSATLSDISHKRRKTAVSELPFLIKPCVSDKYSIQSEVVEANSSLMEDIDLELRLGESPLKVK